jgi:hypothetical protein
MAYTSRRRRSKALPLWSFIAVPVGLFGLLYTISQFNTEFQENSKTMTETSRNSAMAEVETAFAEAEQVRAISRYQSGVCIKVPNGLVAGLKFEELEPNNFVCTVDGVTGTINRDRVAADIARTNNQEVVRNWRGW